jgi:hypothetical protein
MIRAVYRAKSRPDEDWGDMTDDIREEVVGEAIVVVNAMSHRLLMLIRKNLSRPGAGTPAAPGDSPARQRGDLYNAFSKIPAWRSQRSTSKKASRVYGGVQTAALHPTAKVGWLGIIRTLEYGATINGRHHPARPFIRPAEEVMSGELDRMMARLFQ